MHDMSTPVRVTVCFVSAAGSVVPLFFSSKLEVFSYCNTFSCVRFRPFFNAHRGPPCAAFSPLLTGFGALPALPAGFSLSLHPTEVVLVHVTRCRLFPAHTYPFNRSAARLIDVHGQRGSDAGRFLGGLNEACEGDNKQKKNVSQFILQKAKYSPQQVAARAAVVRVSPRTWPAYGINGATRVRTVGGGSFISSVDLFALFLVTRGSNSGGRVGCYDVSRYGSSGKVTAGVAVVLVVYLVRACRPLIVFGCVRGANSGGGGGGGFLKKRKNMA